MFNLKGLLDKLRAMLNTTQSEDDPLADATVKNYYEMIYGMRMSLVAGGPEEDIERVKNYIESYLGVPCDEEKAKKAIELINMGRKEHPQTKTEIALKELNKQLKEAKKYTCSQKKAFVVCYKEHVDHTVSALSNVLNVIKEDPTDELLEQGLRKMRKNAEGTIVDTEWHQFLYHAIRKCFFAENETMKEIVRRYFYGLIEERVQGKAAVFLGAVALRALSFEKNSKSEEGYESFSDSECRAYVSTYKPIVDYLEKHPFDKEEYIERFVKQIRSLMILRLDFNEFEGNYLTRCMKKCAYNDDYFDDAVCYQFWTEVKEQYGDETKTVGDMVDKMIEFICNS